MAVGEYDISSLRTDTQAGTVKLGVVTRNR